MHEEFWYYIFEKIAARTENSKKTQTAKLTISTCEIVAIEPLFLTKFVKNLRLKNIFSLLK